MEQTATHATIESEISATDVANLESNSGESGLNHTQYQKTKAPTGRVNTEEVINDDPENSKDTAPDRSQDDESSTNDNSL